MVEEYADVFVVHLELEEIDMGFINYQKHKAYLEVIVGSGVDLHFVELMLSKDLMLVMFELVDLE